MFEKDGKFYADWRDQDGHRTRKSFTSKRAALQHEAEQKDLRRPKPTPTGRLSLISSSEPPKSASMISRGRRQQKPSSPRQEVALPKSYALPKLRRRPR
jgi:hypothetical protein